MIPSLSTFCVYAAIGVLALYILQATFFVACVSLDEMRIDSNRNACLLCYKHEESYKPGKFHDVSLQYAFMRKIWGPLLTKNPVKVRALYDRARLKFKGEKQHSAVNRPFIHFNENTCAVPRFNA